MSLSNLRPAEGATKTGKRIGRGTGSGLGGTSTRGHKGAKSRSGYSKKIGFEGGQMPIQRRLPKFGFKNINRVEYKAINLSTLQALAEAKNLGVPVVGVVDTNANPTTVDYVIPGNDDAIKGTQLLLDYFVAAVAEGKTKEA